MGYVNVVMHLQCQESRDLLENVNGCWIPREDMS